MANTIAATVITIDRNLVDTAIAKLQEERAALIATNADLAESKAEGMSVLISPEYFGLIDGAGTKKAWLSIQWIGGGYYVYARNVEQEVAYAIEEAEEDLNRYVKIGLGPVRLSIYTNSAHFVQEF